MKRSTKVFLGAMGLVTAAWGVERAMQPKLPPCPVGVDGKPVVTFQVFKSKYPFILDIPVDSRKLRCSARRYPRPS